ncbi:hypothetical protein CSB37_02020 [bacterium DOLZORAL124_38_8]|nr:MAG: hypothetical protein CSB37_02020 [bacterium DOLZORAL124_38_8]
MKVQVFDYRWREKEAKDFFVEFEGNNGQKIGRKRLWLGHSLSIEKLGTPNCAGHISPETKLWRPCPKDSKGKFKCEYCRSIEGGFVFTAFDGFDTSQLSPADLARIEGEHWVYLAYFGEGMVKVGVSQFARKFLRQIEQGSAATLFIAKTPDGVFARQIETLIRKTGLADKIKTSQKKDFLFPEVSSAKQTLFEVLKTHVSGLDGEHESLKQYLLPEPEFFDWTDVGMKKLPTHNIHPIKLDVGEWVSGEIVGLKGPFIILDTGDDLVSLAPKDFRGCMVDFALKQKGLGIQSALQNSLF